MTHSGDSHDWVRHKHLQKVVGETTSELLIDLVDLIANQAALKCQKPPSQIIVFINWIFINDI